MLFHSTRGVDKDKTFADILMQGLASDGGLFMPDTWPQVEIEKVESMQSFQEIAEYIVPFFTASSFSEQETHKVLKDAWHDFEIESLIEIKPFNNYSILELFHGPTAAFKDFGLQLAAAFFNEILNQENKTALVLGATSGDTGSAAIDSCKKYSRIKSFIMLPNGNMSQIQRRQMTTVMSENVRAIRVNGTFDDCQDLVKQAFKVRDFLNNDQYLLAVNSINWTRIVGQICYYFYAYANLRDHKSISFSVPTGNFGNVFACYSAYKMGLPLKSISVAVNENDILHRFFSNNDYSKHAVLETISPSMDISVASNFERLVYDFFLDRDSNACANLFNSFPSNAIKFDSTIWEKRHEIFLSHKVTDKETKEIISSHFFETNYLLDPHTAIGIPACIENLDSSNHYVLLATAHPAKFPKLYEELNIDMVDVPSSLMNLGDKEENLYRLNANYDELSNFIKINNFN